MESARKRTIKQAIFARPYWVIFVVVTIGFFLLNIFINDSHLFYGSLGSFKLWFVISFIVFSVLVSLLVALNVNLALIRVKTLRGSVGAKEGGVAAAGLFGGVLAGSCPACFAGLFPAFIGLFGITMSLSSLPFAGLELQVASLLLLLLSVYMLSSDPVCKIKQPKKGKRDGK